MSFITAVIVSLQVINLRSFEVFTYFLGAALTMLVPGEIAKGFIFYISKDKKLASKLRY